MENIRELGNKFILSMLISLIIFYNIKIDLTIYSTLIIFIWILMFLNYSFRNNIELFDTVLILSIANLGAYIFNEKYIYNNLSCKHSINIMISIVFLFCMSTMSFFVAKRDYPRKEGKKLLLKRKKDLERLLEYINKFNIVGLNGEWGSGKSFLIDKFKNKTKEEYEIIEIDVLSCNLDELQLILINELEKVLNKNRVISKYSNGLKRFLSKNKFAFTISNLIFENNNTYSEAIKGFKNELDKIEKKIVIIYEDIDRISEKHIIKKIFGISEKISNDKIKIIYQYDEENLNRIGFTDQYLEKYIPFKVNLTKLDFFEIVHFVLAQKEIDDKILKDKDLEFLKLYRQNNRYNILYEEFGLLEKYSIEIKNNNIRKIENFLSELNNMLQEDEYNDNKETTISFFIVKHFLPFIYKKLSIGRGVIDTLKFNIESQSYTIDQLINLYRSDKIGKEMIQAIFEKEENRIIYGVLKLFDYKDIIPKKDLNNEERFKSIMEEPIDILKNKNENNKKDRLIWNLLANGKSKYTNYEYVGKRFINEVLEKPESEQIEAYKKLDEDLFNISLEEDNRTIFLMGIPKFIELFKAFSLLGVNHKYQSSLINLYIEMKKIKNINIEFIQAMNYCSIETREKYLYILEIMGSNLNISGNLNSEECFVDFLKRFIDNLSSLGYINTRRYFNFQNIKHMANNQDYMAKELKDINKKLIELKDKINSKVYIKELNDEIATIATFIEKMINVICSKETLKNKVPSIHTEFSFKHVNQKEFDRLKDLETMDEETKEEIRLSYLNGKITVYEIDKLIDELK